MYQSRNSNLLSIACQLVFLATVYIPTPVQSQRPYELVSAIVDSENPRNADLFTLDIYEKIEFARVDGENSQVSASTEDGTEKIAHFRSLDYHTMILDVVIFDTGDPKRMVKCQFKNKDDAKEFYRFLAPPDAVDRFYNTMKYGVISVLQFDYNRARCGSGTRDDRSCDDNYHRVSAAGLLCIQILTRSPKNRPLMKRFAIVGNDDKTHMVFTSKTFNMKLAGNNEYIVMSIRMKYLSSDILIQFRNKDAALRFSAYLQNYSDIDRKIPVTISNADLKSIFGNQFKSE